MSRTAKPSRRRSADVVVYAPFAGPLYAGERVGGAELQALQIARALAAADLRVRHVVTGVDRAHGGDGVELVPLGSGYRRRGVPQRVAVLRALREADGAVYIQRTAGIETGLVGAFARATGRRFVFSASHDADFTRDRRSRRGLGGGLEAPSKWAQYRVGLRLADRVVAQTEQQAELARLNHGLRARVIRSFCSPAAEAAIPREAFLWVGAAVDFKQPLAYLALAERVPEARFWMIAPARGPAWQSLAEEIESRAARLPNLELLPARPRAELLELYDRAIAVVNTSDAEGFPNTFLEGWARGAPALSLRIDPDRLLERHGIGLVAGGSIERLARHVRHYLERPADASAAGAAARAYVRRVHAPEVVGAEWASLVDALLRTAAA